MLDRGRLGRQLRQSEEQLRQAVEAADAGSWSLTSETGEFAASDRAVELHGLALGTPLTHDAAMARVHPDDRAGVEEAVRQTVETGEAFRHEHRVLQRDGSVRWVASQAERIDTGDGHALVGLVQDVTLRKQAEQALRSRQAEERATALTLQRSLLPARLPEHPDVRVAARYVAASDSLVVGGDWYDAFTLDDGRLALTVGDVVGSGLDAALAMGQLRTALAACAAGVSPGELLRQLDAFLARSGITDFATVCFAVYDPATGALEYASAGHPPMVVLAPGGRVRRLDAAQSPPLVGDTSWKRNEATVALEPGSLLVLYSDGLIERRGESIDTGLDRLGAAMQAVAGAPVDDVCDGLLAAMDVDVTWRDDVVVLAARVGCQARTDGASR